MTSPVVQHPASPVAATSFANQRLTAAEACLPSLMNSGWTVAETLPASYRARLPGAIEAADAALEPVNIKAFAVIMDPFLEWLTLCGKVQVPDELDDQQRLFARIVRMYHEVLCDFPADILAEALLKIRQRHKWKNLPDPAEVRELGLQELERRRFLLRRLRTAERLGRFEEPPQPRAERPTPEEKAAFRDILARVAKQVRPGHEAERPGPDRNPAALVYPPSDAQVRRILGDTSSHEQSAQVAPIAENPEIMV